MNNQRLMDIYNTATIASLDEIRDMANDLMDLQDKAKPAKFEVKMDDQGNVIIPLSDYLREVAPEVKEELAKDNLWSFPLWQETVKTIATEYASENYNNTIDKIRDRLLMSDLMPLMVREWSRGKVGDLDFAQQKASWYMDWAFKLYHWASKFSYEDRADMPKQSEYKSSYIKQEVVDACIAEFNALGAVFPDPEPEDVDA